MNSSTHLAQHEEQIDRIWNNLLQKWEEEDKSQPTVNSNSHPLHDSFTTVNSTNVTNMTSPTKENYHYKEDSSSTRLTRYIRTYGSSKPI